MAVALKLMRFGKKGHPTYRIVAIDRRAPRVSEYLEKIGIYQPIGAKPVLEISKSRLEYWQSKGAQLSEGIVKLLKDKKRITFKD